MQYLYAALLALTVAALLVALDLWAGAEIDRLGED